jgi:predicted ATPase/DNA-binding SARP family transcriptional activator
VEFGVLGPLEAADRGRCVSLGKPKQRTLLAVLLVNANTTVGAGELIEELWPDGEPATARHSLEVYVSGLRKALGSEIIETRRPGYLMRVESEQLDLSRFERLIEQGHDALVSGQPAVAATALRKGLDLWRGRPFEDVEAGPHIDAARRRLEELRVGAIEDRIDADLGLGSQARVVAELEALLLEHPYRERLYAQLMLALYRCGRQADALDAFQTARRRLLNELGLEPGQSLQSLQQAILDQDARLDFEPQSRCRASPPAARTPLIGRQRELEDLQDLLLNDGVRLVTLTGVGGIGKTRLATELAGTLVERFAHGAALVELAALTDATQVADAIAEKLGIPTGSATPVASAVAGYLRHKELLLVLDNFEHLLEGAELVSDLLEEAPDIRFVVTSRRALGLYGEHEYRVPPLTLPVGGNLVSDLTTAGSVQFFVDRARAARFSFALTEENAAAVAKICAALDGLPLAIELAAARIKSLSAEALLSTFGQGLNVVAEGARDSPERHRTLRDAIAWSYRLLEPDLGEAFARLAVFAGTFSAESARDVCDVDLDRLQRLVGESLLQPELETGTEPRFRLLETIREYGEERLIERGELDGLRRRHAEFFTAVAERAEVDLRGPSQLELLARLDADNANMRAAVRWALDHDAVEQPLRIGASLWRHWESRGSITEARALLDEALRRPVRVPRPTRARALFASGRIALRQGDYEHADVVFRESLDLARLAGDSVDLALSLAGLGWVAHMGGRTGDAVALCREALTAARATGEAWVLGDVLNNLGSALCAQGDLEGASESLEEGLELRRQIGDLEGVTATLCSLAWLAAAEEDYERAQRLFEQGLAVSDERRDVWYHAAKDVVLGYVALGRGDLVRARALCVRGVKSCRELGYPQYAAQALETLAAVVAAEGHATEAGRLFGASSAYSKRHGVPLMRPAAVSRALTRARQKLGHAEWDETVRDGFAYELDDLLNEVDSERDTRAAQTHLSVVQFER